MTALCGVPRCTAPAETLEVCDAHQAKVTALLSPAGLAQLYVELNLALRPSGNGSSDGPVVSMSKEKRLPIASQARDAQLRILAEMHSLETDMRNANGWIPIPLRGREGPRLQAACTVLGDHLASWLTAETAERVLKLGRVARGALGLGGPRSNRYDLPCPHCNEPALLRRNGTDRIACGYCGGVVTAEWVDDQLDPPCTREAA